MRRRGVVLFLGSAVLVRSMDAGAGVGLVLLCTDRVSHDPVRVAGLLAAALTALHVTGPLSAPLLGRVRDRRWVVSMAGLVASAGVALGTVVVGSWPMAAAVVPWAVAGACGPMLTGGLSSLLPSGVGDGRRSRALDALTYGASATVAPALVALLATTWSSAAALWALAGCGALGSAGVLVLPRAPAASSEEQPVTSRQVAAHLWREPRLRTVVALTWVGALTVSAALLTGTALARRQGSAEAGWVVSAFGLGGLAAGLGLAVRPLRARPDAGMVLVTGVLGAVLAGCAVVGADAPFLAAGFGALGGVLAVHTLLSLSARGELSPPHLAGPVFVAVGGAKVAFSSAGTALAGFAAAWGGQRVLAGLGVVTVLSALGIAPGALRRAGFSRPARPGAVARAPR
ncbi:hypothetical protein ACFUC1_08280 [Pedococcus sp. NPDC057267]|uniref:hypothetical protein n=1 Tax=Pedococcus sp. NPDC057267 TaxID=3346077 RepID=UPI003636C725